VGLENEHHDGARTDDAIRRFLKNSLQLVQVEGAARQPALGAEAVEVGEEGVPQPREAGHHRVPLVAVRQLQRHLDGDLGERPLAAQHRDAQGPDLDR